MHISILKTLLAAFAVLAASSVFAGDREDADKAAKAVLTSLQNKNYEGVWNNQMSEFFRSKMTKDSFLANMTIGRQQLGTLTESKFIDMAYSQIDPDVLAAFRADGPGWQTRMNAVLRKAIESKASPKRRVAAKTDA